MCGDFGQRIRFYFWLCIDNCTFVLTINSLSHVFIVDNIPTENKK